MNFITLFLIINRYLPVLCGIGFWGLATAVYANNTSGVHGPNVDANDTSMQFRVALSPADDSSQQDFWAYRYHLQHSLNDKVRLRLTSQFRDREHLEYEYLRAELLYNFKKAVNSIWASAVRFDIRTRRAAGAEDISIHWTNEWSLTSGYRLRALIIANQQFGDNRESNDLALATRFGISKKINQDIRLGLELFNNYGRLGDFGSYQNQSHQFGPSLASSFAGIKYQIRWLAGLTDASRNNNIEARFTKSF